MTKPMKMVIAGAMAVLLIAAGCAHEAKNAAPSGAQTLAGEANGINGAVKVEVKADADKIYSVEVKEHSETEGIGTNAVDAIPGAIVEKQSLDVDAVAGATITSTAIKDAVKAALESGGIDASKFGGSAAAAGSEAAGSEAAGSESAAAAVDPADIPDTAKTVTGEAQGLNGPVKVEVVADDEKIYSVKVTEHKETEGIGSVAAEKIPAAMVEQQTFNVDAMSGATITSTAIKDGVKSALESAGIATAAFETAKAGAAAEDRTVDVDVCIVGAGGAGISAAIEASDAGKKVVILESQAMAGGNSTRSTGGLNAAKTKLQDENEFDEKAGVEKTLKTAKEEWADNKDITDLAATVEKQWEDYQANSEGYFDSVELFELDTMIGGHGINDMSLVKFLCENSADAIDWLDKIGAPLKSVGSFGGASVKRIHRPVDDEGKTKSVGAYLIPILTKNLDDRGIEVIYDTTADEILMADGKVAGVHAKGNAGNEVTVNAPAVVLATGGFGYNNDMVAKYQPDFKGYMSTNAPGAMGQGIDMATAVGADVVDMDQIQLHPTVEKNTASLITEGLRGDGAILVNSEGKRFFDEVSTRDKVSAAEFKQPGEFAWLIVDQAMVDASSVIQGYINKGLTIEGKDAADLAANIKVDAAAFEQTLEDWNKCVEAKEDKEFGRTSFANPLSTAPYYAIQVAPGIHHTMGGLKINTDTEVLDKDGNAIAGLFAAGEVTGGVHGGNRLGGNAVADIIVFGRQAGQKAAAYK